MQMHMRRENIDGSIYEQFGGVWSVSGICDIQGVWGFGSWVFFFPGFNVCNNGDDFEYPLEEASFSMAPSRAKAIQYTRD